jgi:catechol 2,3-dioxygenase-like lactoylglutathione lyase family enzyme
MDTSINLHHIQIAIPVEGENAARVFYGDLLGLNEIPKPEALVANGGVWFAAGEMQVHLGVEEDFRPAKKAHAAFLVDDLDAMHDRLTRAGYAPHREDRLPGFSRFYVDDPFGNRIEVLSPIKG